MLYVTYVHVHTYIHTHARAYDNSRTQDKIRSKLTNVRRHQNHVFFIYMSELFSIVIISPVHIFIHTYVHIHVRVCVQGII